MDHYSMTNVPSVIAELSDNEYNNVDDPIISQEEVDALTHEVVCTLRELGL